VEKVQVVDQNEHEDCANRRANLGDNTAPQQRAPALMTQHGRDADFGEGHETTDQD